MSPSDTALLERWHVYRDANRTYLREWLPWLDRNTEVEHSRQFIGSILQQHARNEGFTCAIPHGGHIVGIVGYHPIRWASKAVELGYWLSQDAVGKGIMTWCCHVLVDYAFQGLGFNRVAIPAATGNCSSQPSRSVLDSSRKASSGMQNGCMTTSLIT
jgi:ribosomal-protein-serine acetyltransferase